MTIDLLDGSLKVKVYYDPEDSDLKDNICLCILEKCPDEERLFRAEQTHIYLTAVQARQLADSLLHAIGLSQPQDME